MYFSSISKILIIILLFLLKPAFSEDFSFDNVNISKIISAIAKSGNLNIMINKNLSGNASLHLKDVSPEDALILFCRLNSLSMEKDGNIYIIGTNPSIYSGFLYNLYSLKAKDLKRIMSMSYPHTFISIINQNKVWIRYPSSISKEELTAFIKNIDSPPKNISVTLYFYENSGDFSSNKIEKGQMKALVMQGGEACFHAGTNILLPWWGIIYKKGYFLNVRADNIHGDELDIEFNWNIPGTLESSSGTNKLSLKNGKKTLIGALFSEKKEKSYSIVLKTDPSIIFSSSKKKRNMLLFIRAEWQQ